MDLGGLTIDLAKRFEGTAFEVATPDGVSRQMTLDQVLPLVTPTARRSRGAPIPKRAPFALYFLGPAGEVLPQGMYTFRSDGLTLTGIFIVPIGKDDAATEYESIFT